MPTSWRSGIPGRRKAPQEMTVCFDRSRRSRGRCNRCRCRAARTRSPALHRAGFRLGVATNDSTGGAEKTLLALGIAQMFDAAYGYDGVANPKPAPDAIQAFCDLTGLKPSQIADGRRQPARSGDGQGGRRGTGGRGALGHRHARVAAAAGGRSAEVHGRPAGLSRFRAMSATVGTAEIGPAHLPRVDVEAFILANMPLVPVPSIAGISLHTAQPSSGLWRLLGQGGGGGHSPYWAYPWAGGAALARHFLAHPEIVRGRSVLDLGAGSGLVAIAAVRAGAASTIAADIDPLAAVATRLNAAANGVGVSVVQDDLTKGPPPSVDMIAVGDLFYDRQLALRVTAFLDRCLAQASTYWSAIPDAPSCRISGFGRSRNIRWRISARPARRSTPAYFRSQHARPELRRRLMILP